MAPVPAAVNGEGGNAAASATASTLDVAEHGQMGSASPDLGTEAVQIIPDSDDVTAHSLHANLLEGMD